MNIFAQSYNNGLVILKKIFKFRYFLITSTRKRVRPFIEQTSPNDALCQDWKLVETDPLVPGKEGF